MLNYDKYTNISIKAALVKVFIGIIGIVFAANISIPTYPVPFSLQTYMIMVISFLYTPKESISTVSGYLLLGILGFPVLANFNGGIAYFIGTTFGYLIGFLIGTIVIGYLRTKSSFSTVTIAIIFELITYSLGTLWLSTFISAKEALYYGILYAPSEIMKILLLLITLRIIKKA